MPRKVMNPICSAERKEKSRNSSWMTGVRLSKNAVRVIGSKPISKICLRTFRRGVRIKGGDLLKIISFLLNCVTAFKKNLSSEIKHETVVR